MPKSYAEAEALSTNADIFLTNCKLTGNAAELLTGNQADAKAYLVEAGHVDGLRKQLLQRVDHELLEKDMDELLKEHQSAGSKFFGKAKAMSAFVDKLKAHFYTAVSFDQIPALLNEIKSYQQQEKRLKDKLYQVPERFRDTLKQFDNLSAFEKAQEALQSAKRFPGGRSAIARLSENTEVAEAAEQYMEALAQVAPAAKALNTLLMRDAEAGS